MGTLSYFYAEDEMIEILDPEKGPLKILLNIQKRRRNRLRWLESERKKRAERGHGYYQVGLYDRRIETVEKALEIGRREINSIKTFVAILQTLPWKLQKNFQQKSSLSQVFLNTDWPCQELVELLKRKKILQNILMD